MNYKTIFHYGVRFLHVAGILFSSFLICAQGPFGPMPPGMLDPKEQEIFEAISKMSQEEQEQLLNQIFEEVSKLPADQQEEFWKEVEREAARIEQIQDFVAEQAPVPTIEPVVPEVPAGKPTPEQKPVQELKPADQERIEKAAVVIDTLLNKIENVMRKAQIIPGFTTKIEQWARKGLVPHWSAGASWQQVRAQIEGFIQKLHKIKDRDPKTQDYKYLGALVKKETVYNNITYVQRSVTNAEAHIQIPDFGIEAISPSTKQALQTSIGAILEAISVLGIPQELDKIIEEYEPRAKELKEEQEQFQKQAELEAKKPRIPSPVVHAGLPPAPPSRPVDSRYEPYFPSSYQTPPFTYDSYKPEQPAFDKKDVTTPEQPIVGKDGMVKKDIKEEKPKAPDKGPEKKEAKPDEKKKPKKDVIAKDHISSINKSLNTAVELISESKLQNIDRYMLDHSPVDPKLNTTIPVLNGVLIKGGTTVKALKDRIAKRITDPEMKKQYKEDVKDIVEAYQAPLKKLSDQIQRVRANRGKVSEEKQYAYLGGPGTEELIAHIPNPVSLLELKDSIDEFLKISRGL